MAFPQQQHSLVMSPMHACTLSFQSCPTLCDPMDCGPPGSPVHGSFRARILGRVAMPSCRASSRPRISHGSSTAGRFFTAEPAGEPTMSYTRTQKAMSVHCSFSTRPHGTVSCLTYSSLQPFLFCFCLENIQSFLPSLHAVTSIPNPIVLPNALPSE